MSDAEFDLIAWEVEGRSKRSAHGFYPGILMNFFRRRRVALGLTQRNIAISLNITTSTVSAWENGECLPRRKIESRVAEVYQVTAKRLQDEIRRMSEFMTLASEKP